MTTVDRKRRAKPLRSAGVDIQPYLHQGKMIMAGSIEVIKKTLLMPSSIGRVSGFSGMNAVETSR
ncbi:hypothetical protein OK016_02600 [Vibrio chagasii]|nr:hypothetical protein [Vibrio chagasii]